MTTQTEALKLLVEALSLYETRSDGLVNKALAAGKKALAKPEQETQAYREAAQLAKWLFKKHYAQEEHYASGRVVWGLCDTTAGVISQIDNMVCKLVLPKEPEQEPVAITAQMAFAFHKAITDGALGTDDMMDIMRGLEAAFAHITTPPQRKPLTDEMIVAGGKALAKLHAESCGLDFDDVWKYYAEDHKADAKAAIEAAHGIKEST